jgi:glycerol-3-phosphate cytidylyltransferase
MTRIITFGTYDIFHVGHLRLLQRARAFGDHLTVGISTDELNVRKKGRAPVYPFTERCEILRGLCVVDEIFAEESLEQKRDYILEHRADVLVMGDDWEGRFDDLLDICKVRYLPRTPAVSTTAVIEKIRS